MVAIEKTDEFDLFRCRSDASDSDRRLLILVHLALPAMQCMTRQAIFVCAALRARVAGLSVGLLARDTLAEFGKTERLKAIQTQASQSFGIIAHFVIREWRIGIYAVRQIYL